MPKSLLFLVLLASFTITDSLADEKNKNTTEITIVPSGYDTAPLTEIKPKEELGKIYSGKKVVVANTNAIPEVTSNNYRQSFSQIPGLLVSEVPNESFTSLSYRGLGDPHETFNLNVLQDDVPLNFDLYGYPASYYAPPSDFVDQVEFTHGGAALLYGAQPGGALNYKTRSPVYDRELAARTKHVFGSKNLYSTYNEVSGTKGDTSYLLAYHHRESDGFRSQNSNSNVDFGSLKLENKLTDSTKIFFEQDIYDGSFDEAGGLGLTSAEGVGNYYEDRWQSTLKYDTLSIIRYVSSVGMEHEYDADTNVYVKLWGGYNSRNSKRQAYGTAPSFGGFANGTTNTIQLQEFRTAGFQTRGSHNWEFAGEKQTLALGLWLYGVDSPYSTEKGGAPDAEVGDLTRKLDRNTYAGALFAENKFSFGKFSITPGVRVENIHQDVDETFNPSATGDLKNTDSDDLVPLAGLGVSYDLPKEFELYANFSQGFKPVTFQDTLPLGPTDQISSDINEAKVNNYEIGVRGDPVNYLSLDTSFFYSTYSNQFGRVGPSFGNTGKGRYFGYDVAANLDVVTLSDKLFNSELSKAIGTLSLYGNASFLNAEFTEGSLDGKTPQYAPSYLVKTGVVYNPRENTKIALLGNILADHFADDGNTLNFYIPSYRVWDLTVDVSVLRDRLSLVAGINNIFDEEYYSRVRSNGVDPSLPRNVYAGFNVYY